MGISLSGAPLVALPRPHWPGDLAFDAALLIPFLVAGLGLTLTTVGSVSTAQKINDETWAQPDMTSVRGGVVANAPALIGAGFIGGMGQGIYPASVGLSLAIGVTSRWVGFVAGGLFIVFAFIPALAAALVLMPAPVKGAILVYVACFIVVAGLQLIMTRMMDTRKILVVGGSIIAGVSVGFLPELYAGLPTSLQAITSSPLSFATVVAILLNLACRVGITRRATLTLGQGEDRREAVVRFMHRTGGAWGARMDVVRRATSALLEFVDVARPMAQAGDRIRINARFDEFRFDLYLLYGGPRLDLPETPPSPQAAVADPDRMRSLSGHMIRAAASEVHATRRGALNLLHLRFDH